MPAKPKRTIIGLEQELLAVQTELDAVNSILDQVMMANLFEEPPKPGALILPSGMPQVARENPEVVVSITVNGKGVRTRSTFSAETVKENGWAQIIAEACMQPMGLLARELTQKGGEVMRNGERQG